MSDPGAPSASQPASGPEPTLETVTLKPVTLESVTLDAGSGEAAAEEIAALTVARWGDGPATVVLLHDGLGSIDQWRAIPGRIAAETGHTVLAYDRPGHGRSTPVPTGPWPADWLHREAERLGRLLAAVDVDRPILIGHSDGGSIALLHAATTGGRDLRGVLTLAAHTWVEQACLDGVTSITAQRDQAVLGLARSHAHPEAVFDAWSGVWRSGAFRPWDVRDRLAAIACPTIVAQGHDDEYATPGHVTSTAEAIGPSARPVLLDGVGHLLHHEDPDLVVRVAAEAIREFTGAGPSDRPV